MGGFLAMSNPRCPSPAGLPEPRPSLACPGTAMLRFIVSRLGITVMMAVLATLVIFLIANIVPGDPILAQLGDVAASNKEFVAEWRAKWGLDLPLWERYFIFLKGLVHGDLGISISS